MTQEKWKPRLLVYLDQNSSKLEELIQERKADIDRRYPFDTRESSADIFAEYDGIIINSIHPHESHRDEQLENFLKETSGILVFVLNRFKGAWNSPNNYRFCQQLISTTVDAPNHVFDIQASGSKSNLTAIGSSSIFAEYLSISDLTWHISLKSNFIGKAVPLALSKNGNATAFMLSQYQGRAFFVPWLKNEDVFWAAVLDAVYGSSRVAEQAADWVGVYTLPTLDGTTEEIRKLDEQISTLEQEKGRFIKQKGKLEHIRDTLL